MGKGNRNSQQRRETQAALDEKLAAKEKANQKKKNGDRWIAVTCIVLAVIIVGILVLNILNETGVFLRAEDAIYIADGKDISVNSAMMTFFYNDNMTRWYNQYYIYVMYGMMSVDMSSDLTTQKITANDASYLGDSELAGKTWYDYFRDTAIENVEMYLTYAYAGKDIAECALNDEDYAEIDDTIKELKQSLRENQLSFADQYGRGVTESDVRACYELIHRASKFSEYKLEETEKAVDADEDKIVNYREENKEDFYSAKYLYYTISVNEKGQTKDAYNTAVENAKKAVEKIKAAKDPAEFVTLIEQYKKNPTAFITGETTAATESSSASESTTEKETTIEELQDKYTGSIDYETDDELGKWIFEEGSSAEEGDVKVIEEKSTETATETATDTSEEEESGSEEESGTASKTETVTVTYEKYKITVYMLLEKPDVDKTNTHNMAYMLTDNKAAADAFLAEFLAEQSKSRDKFEELAQKHYDALHNVDEDGNHNHAEGESEPTFNHGKIDQAKEKYFSTNYDALNVWLDDAGRVDGDYTSELVEIVVENNDTDKTKTTYYAVILFESHDDPAWRVDALNGAVNEDIEAWYEAELAKNNITYNWEAIDEITGK